jgi:hypothetical protein
MIEHNRHYCQQILLGTVREFSQENLLISMVCFCKQKLELEEMKMI